MPKATKYDLLPGHLKSELDRRIIESGYGDYKEHSEWLKSEGFDLNYNTLADRGKKIRAEIAAMSSARNFAIAYGHAVGEDEQAVPRMINALAQDALYQVAARIHKQACDLPQDDDGAVWSLLKQLNMLTKSLADTSRSDVMVSKYTAEIKAAQAAKLAELTAEGQELGVNEEYLKRLETEWLGLFETK